MNRVYILITLALGILIVGGAAAFLAADSKAQPSGYDV